MIDQAAVCEFAIDVTMGTHFVLHTPKVFLACHVYQLFARFQPATPGEQECQRFLQAYGLQIASTKQAADAGSTRAAISYLLHHEWTLLAGAEDLDTWTGKMVTLRRQVPWPKKAERGWETCSLHSNRGTKGPYLALERAGQKFTCDLDLILSEAPLEDEADRARRRLLGAYGWLTSRVMATRNFLGTQNAVSTPTQTIPLHYLMCLLLRQEWEPTAYGQEFMSPVPWHIKFRRPLPADDQQGPAVAQAWADWLALQAKAPARK